MAQKRVERESGGGGKGILVKTAVHLSWGGGLACGQGAVSVLL